MTQIVRDRDGTLRPKSMMRWRRLTLLAQGPMPPMMLLEDAEDLCDFLLVHRSDVPPSRWATEAIAAKSAADLEGLF